MEYIKNIEKPKIRRQPNLKGSEQICLQRRYTNRQKAHGKKDVQHYQPLGQRTDENLHRFLVETEKSAATLENSLAVLQKVK